MTHYRSNLRDLEFNLFEVAGRRTPAFGRGPFTRPRRGDGPQHPDRGRAAGPGGPRRQLHAGDRNPPVFDPATHTAPLPEEFRRSYQPSWTPSSGGWTCRQGSAAATRRACCGGRSPSWCWGRTPRCGCTPPARRSPTRSRRGHDGAEAVGRAVRRQALGRHHGAHRAGRRLRRRRRPHPGGPAAGRLLAHRGRQAVHHLGRARPDREHHPLRTGPPGRRRGRGGPGTKGLSLFIVPKYLFDPETGELGDATASSPPTSSTRWA